MFHSAILVASLLYLTVIRISAEPCSVDGVYQDKNDVEAYYKCDGNVQTYYRCPPGTIFDLDELNCTSGIPKVRRDRRSIVDKPKVVCYYISWGIYRNGLGKFEPENIDPFLCTHIIYAFAKLDEDSLVMKSADENADIARKSYEKVVAVKRRNPELQVLLAIGGWTESQGDKYSRLVNDREKRKNFIKEATSFLKEHKFDGLDLDWEFPVCWQADCAKGNKSDKESFSEFVKELRKSFDNEKPKLLLSAAVSASRYIAKRSYEIKSLGKNLDFVNVMAYDYHSAHTNGRTGHHSRFMALKKGKDQDNVVGSMKFWEENGVPKKKLIIGIPAYGRTFQLADPKEHGLNAPTAGPGKAGSFTQEGGSLSYYEILEKLRDKGWKMEREEEVGPYAYGEGEWVGYDDEASCKRKAKFAKDSGYGGVMVWELASDDFTGSWGNKKYPLVKAMKEGLEAKGGGTKWKANSYLVMLIAILVSRSLM